MQFVLVKQLKYFSIVCQKRLSTSLVQIERAYDGWGIIRIVLYHYNAF